jgi:hypothetical protein
VAAARGRWTAGAGFGFVFEGLAFGDFGPFGPMGAPRDFELLLFLPPRLALTTTPPLGGSAPAPAGALAAEAGERPAAGGGVGSRAREEAGSVGGLAGAAAGSALSCA